MFLVNKYTKIYYQIIERARSRVPEGYSENHHVIPKSMGGSNKKENLVSLMAREHFVCHWLLVKMTTGSDRAKMVYGLRMMGKHNNGHERYNNSFTSRVYESYKKEFIEEHTRRMTGRIPSEETRRKLSESQKGKKLEESHIRKLRIAAKNKPPVSEETRKKLSASNMGKKRSPEAIAKFSLSRKGHEVSLETREKIKKSLAETRKTKPVIGKPHSAETKLLLSKINKGKKVSDETREKLRMSNSGRKLSEETKIKMRKPKSPATKEKMRLAASEREAKKRESGYVVSEETKAKLRKKYVCPQCGYMGNKATLSKFHMDKCKLKIVDL